MPIQMECLWNGLPYKGYHADAVAAAPKTPPSIQAKRSHPMPRKETGGLVLREYNRLDKGGQNHPVAPTMRWSESKE